MEKLLDKPLEVLKTAIDSSSIKPLEFIGDVLVEFYNIASNYRRSDKKCKIYMAKIEELLEHTGKKNDVSQFRKTYEQLLEEFGLSLEGKLNSEEEIPRKKVSGKRIYELYDKPLTPLPEDSRGHSECYGEWS